MSFPKSRFQFHALYSMVQGDYTLNRSREILKEMEYKNLRVVSDGKMPLNPRQSNLGSLFHSHPHLFPCDAVIPVVSTVPPQPTDSASGSSVGEDFASRSLPNLCQQEKSFARISISTWDLNRYLKNAIDKRR